MVDINKLKEEILSFDELIKNEKENHEFEYGIVKKQKLINGLHPHTEAIYRFINSEYYNQDIKNYYNDYFINNSNNSEEYRNLKKDVREKNRQNIIIYEKNLIQKGISNLERNDFLPYLGFFNIQLAVETTNETDNIRKMYCRHGCSSKAYLLNNLENIETAFYFAEKLEKCNQKMNWDEIVNAIGWQWHNHIIALSWKFYQIGLGKYSIKILKPLYDVINIFLDNKNLDDKILSSFFEKNPIFRNRPYSRIKNSVIWCLSMSYLQLNDKENYLKTLKELVDWSPYNRNVCYRQNSRHLEAAIRVYSIEKNETNLYFLSDILNTAISKIPDENTESLMERCIVMYEYIHKIIDNN